MPYFYLPSSRDRVFHAVSCPYVKYNSADELDVSPSLFSALRDRWRPCKHCMGSATGLYNELPGVLDYAKRHGMTFDCWADNLTVQSYSGKWRIVFAGGRFSLFHQNYRGHKGYHDQRFCSFSLMEQLQYINDHDLYRYIHPQQNPPKKKRPAPKKGTKRYKKQQQYQKQTQRNKAIASVLRTIESLSA